jgi:hypothetical protein
MAEAATLTIRNDAGVILSIENPDPTTQLLAVERATPGIVSIEVTPEKSHVHVTGTDETMQFAHGLVTKMETSRPVNIEQTRILTTLVSTLVFFAVVLTGYTLTLTFGHARQQSMEQSK